MNLMTVPEFFKVMYGRNLRILSGVLAITGVCIAPAGWRHLQHAVEQTLEPAGFDPIANPDYGWSFILFQVFLWLPPARSSSTAPPTSSSACSSSSGASGTRCPGRLTSTST